MTENVGSEKVGRDPRKSDNKCTEDTKDSI